MIDTFGKSNVIYKFFAVAWKFWLTKGDNCTF
jgi:hypothetical protein